MTHKTPQPIRSMDPAEMTMLERQLLNDFQRDFPLSATPYADLADSLGVSEADVIETLRQLMEQGVISRVGAVFKPNRIGASTLAAMAVPEDELEQVAAMVSGYDEVNHNYEREHHFNLWFVATAANETCLLAVLDEIEAKCGYKVLHLPLVEDYHIDLGFDLKWS